MINIRTVTYNISKKFNDEEFNIIEQCINKWNKNKYFIRTTRISTPIINKTNNKYEKLNDFCDKNNINWFSIPVIIKNKKMSDYCYELINKYNKAFINIQGVNEKVIDFYSIDQYIELMKKVGSNNPEDNFRLGLSINIEENTPFFPFSKSSNDLSFSIGLELTSEINMIVDKYKNKDLNFIRNKIIKIIDKQINEIEKYALSIEKKYNIRFDGFDFSLAPIVEENGSIGELINKLGIKIFEGPGILFITAYLTNILKSFGNNHRHIGFSGVMYSLLEDTYLSNINNNKIIKLEDMIKLSTMCGCGIDMIPIHIDEDNEVIKSYILDTCAISCRLDKPLGVRFIPQPSNKKITSLTNDPDFIINTRVLNLFNNKLLNNGIKKFELIKIKR